MTRTALISLFVCAGWALLPVVDATQETPLREPDADGGFTGRRLVRAGGAGSAGGLSRGPYLQSATPSSIVVRWRTDEPGDSRVIYGGSADRLTSDVTDPALTNEHAVTIANLEPDTRYYYAVGTSDEILVGGDAGHFFVTAPTPGSARPVRVWVLGDSGTGDVNAAAVRDAYYEFSADRETDLWLMLGDNAYQWGTDSDYQAAVFEIYPEMLRKACLWPTMGNHDAASAYSPTQSGTYFEIFTLPRQGESGGVPSGTEAYYSFDYANVHFVVLDSHGANRSPQGPMMTWLDLDLASTTQEWIVAYWHHPPYSKGKHDSDSETRLIEMRTNALPILEGHGVDLVLTGHSHSYERSMLIDGHYGHSASFDESMIVDGGDGAEDGDGAYAKQAGAHLGTVYTVAGSSGKTDGGGPFDHPAMLEGGLVLGSVVLDVAGDRLDARFLDATGVIRDHYTIEMSVPALQHPPAPTNLSVN